MEKTLIIHPDAKIRLQIERILERSGLQVFQAADGPEGEKAVRRCRPHLILCAAQWMEALSGVLRHRKGKLHPIVILLQGARHALAEELRTAADGLLQLPLDERALVTVIRAYLGRRPASRRIAATPPLDPLSCVAERLLPLTEKFWKFGRLAVEPQAKEAAQLPSGLVESLARDTACFLGREADLQCHVERGLIPLGHDELATTVGELVENACKFSPAGTPIKVFVLRGEDRIEVCVRDYGFGMTQEQIESFRGPALPTGGWLDQGGLGLGLVMVKLLTEGRGGRFQIHSFPRSGTLVRVDFPIWKGKATASEEPLELAAL